MGQWNYSTWLNCACECAEIPDASSSRCAAALKLKQSGQLMQGDTNHQKKREKVRPYLSESQLGSKHEQNNAEEDGKEQKKKQEGIF